MRVQIDRGEPIAPRQPQGAAHLGARAARGRRERRQAESVRSVAHADPIAGASEWTIRPKARASTDSSRRRNAPLVQSGARPSKLCTAALQRLSPWTLTTRGPPAIAGAAARASAAGCSESLTMKRAPAASRASRPTSRARPRGEVRYAARWRSVRRASRRCRSSNSSAKPPEQQRRRRTQPGQERLPGRRGRDHVDRQAHVRRGAAAAGVPASGGRVRRLPRGKGRDLRAHP